LSFRELRDLEQFELMTVDLDLHDNRSVFGFQVCCFNFDLLKVIKNLFNSNLIILKLHIGVSNAFVPLTTELRLLYFELRKNSFNILDILVQRVRLLLKITVFSEQFFKVLLEHFRLFFLLVGIFLKILLYNDHVLLGYNGDLVQVFD